MIAYRRRLPACRAAFAAAALGAAFAATAMPSAEVGRLLEAKGGMMLPDETPAVMDLIVEIHAPAEIAMLREGLSTAERRAILDRRAALLAHAKAALMDALPRPHVEQIRDYGQLPMMVVRVGRDAGLPALLRRPEVVAVYPNGRLRTSLAQSLTRVRQPEAAALGARGLGRTVAVLDTGVDYTKPELGSCSAPGVPADTCRVVAAVELAPGDGSLDDDGHGTHTAAVTLGVAPHARVAALDVFDGPTASFSDVIAGIDWAIANQAAYDIAAINMSLGDGCRYTGPCSVITGPDLLGRPCRRSALNPFSTPIATARGAGMVVVASAGNEGYPDGIAAPGCTPGVVSVGAVYDASFASVEYANCTDTSPVPDQVACFSNSAAFLSLFAPGALITALTESEPGGVTLAGTSEAAPHVAAAVAVLRDAYPAEDVPATEARLTDGVPVNDARNGVTRPRLDLLDALGALNDLFAAALVLDPNAGMLTVDTTDASAEPGEPAHAGEPAAGSIWWTFAATEHGFLSLDTSGSSFDTVLAVYQGDALDALTPVAADADGGTGGASALSFRVTPGMTYAIAVDGVGGATGLAQLTAGFELGSTGAVDEEIPVLPPAAMMALAAALAALGAARMRGR